MKIDLKYQPHLIVSNDETRPALLNLHLDVEGKKLVATEGHMMVAVPCTIEGDIEGPVQPSAFEHARKAAKKAKISEVEMLCGPATLTCAVDGSTLPRAEVCQDFPPWERALPTYRKGDENTFSVTLNAEYLHRLAKALGAFEYKRSGLVTLTFEKDNPLAPIIVSYGADDAIAVLMPRRLD